MALGVNKQLGTTAQLHQVENNGTNDDITLTDLLADRVLFTNLDGGNAGDENIIGFGKNDSILSFKKIFDGNNDGIINFGANGILDIDRTSSKNAGSDQITISAAAKDGLRYLGNKTLFADPVFDGVHVYAHASVRLAGFQEGTVGDDLFNALVGNNTYFYDTALGLNLGGDRITGFASGDRIVTTTKIYNGSADGPWISFGSNGVLDLPGEVDGVAGDQGVDNGGQIEFIGGPSLLALIDESSVGGVNYYYYGVVGDVVV